MRHLFLTLIFLIAIATSVKGAETTIVTAGIATADSIANNIRRTKAPNRVIEVRPSPVDSANALPMLQRVIDELASQGGGRINVASGTYMLKGSLFLRSNIELHLCEGTVLLFSGNAEDFLTLVPTRWEGTDLMGRAAMIYANNEDNIAITGNGIINAQGQIEMARWGMEADIKDFKENTHGTHGETVEMTDVRRLRTLGDSVGSKRIFGQGTYLRPCAMEFYGCTRVLIDGITLKNSPFWCIHPVYCTDVIVSGVTIDSHSPNNDGCDPESSANVLIENCLFRTGDDAVAIKAGRDADGRRRNRPSRNIVIRNCKFYSECNGLCIGSEMSGGVDGVYMYNVEIGNVKNALLFKSNLDRGGYIRNVFVDGIKIESAKGAVLRFETNYFGYRGGNYPSLYEDFYINNVTAKRSDGYGVYYDGPGVPIVKDDGNTEVSATLKNEDFAIRRVRVSNLNIGYTPRPYYFYNTKDCTFTSSTINGITMPDSAIETEVRQSCDVW